MQKSILVTALTVAAVIASASPAAASPAAAAPAAASASGSASVEPFRIVGCDLGGASGSIELEVSRSGSLATITTSRYMMRSEHPSRQRANIKIWAGSKVITESEDALRQDGNWRDLTLRASTGATSVEVEFVFDAPGPFDPSCSTRIAV